MSEIQPSVQTLQPRYVCTVCAAPAVLTYAFPGQPKRGLCSEHRSSVAFFQEPSPGQCIQATVDQLPPPAESDDELQGSVIEG